MPHDFDPKTEDASCCLKICAASADRGTKTEPRHSQSGVIRSFEYWWKLSEKCHNRWRNVGVRLRCWNKNAVVAVHGKILATTKKSTSESLKCEGDVDSFFLIGRVLFSMSLFHVERQSIKSFTWRSWSVWRKLCEGRGLRLGRTRPGCCTMTMHLLTRRFLSVNFWRSKRRLSCPSPPTLQIWPLRTFSCSQSWSPP